MIMSHHRSSGFKVLACNDYIDRKSSQKHSTVKTLKTQILIIPLQTSVQIFIKIS